MNTQPIGCSDRVFESHKLAFRFLITILMTASTAQASTPTFKGDLAAVIARLPRQSGVSGREMISKNGSGASFGSLLAIGKPLPW